MNPFAEVTLKAAANMFVRTRMAKFLGKQKGPSATPPRPSAPQPTPASKPCELRGINAVVAHQCASAAILVMIGHVPKQTPVPEVVPVVEPVVVETPSVIRTMADAFEQKHHTSFFERKFAAITDAIPFDPAWSTDSDVFQHMLTDPFVVQCIAPGAQAKCCDDLGRRMIITGTALGAVVVFQRHAGNNDIIAYNARDVFKQIGFIKSNGDLVEAQIEDILGSVDDESDTNIGNKVQLLLMAQDLDIV